MGYSNRIWTCPFFTWDERQAVHCEGGRVVFQDREAIQEYAERHCASLNGWKDCSIACSLLRYYERKEN